MKKPEPAFKKVKGKKNSDGFIGAKKLTRCHRHNTKTLRLPIRIQNPGPHTIGASEKRLRCLFGRDLSKDPYQ